MLKVAPTGITRVPVELPLIVDTAVQFRVLLKVVVPGMLTTYRRRNTDVTVHATATCECDIPTIELQAIAGNG